MSLHTTQVGDLQYASPATVSRCGMVYVDPKNLGYKPYWERWVGQLAKADCEEFIKLFDKYVPSCISLILEGVMDGRQVEKLRTIVPLSNLNLVSDANADYFYVIGSLLFVSKIPRNCSCDYNYCVPQL